MVAGNGLVVCGDTWQETKLMFETLLQLFNVAIELRKVTATARQGPSNGVAKSAGKRVQVRAAHEISHLQVYTYLEKASRTSTLKNLLRNNAKHAYKSTFSYYRDNSRNFVDSSSPGPELRR